MNRCRPLMLLMVTACVAARRRGRGGDWWACTGAKVLKKKALDRNLTPKKFHAKFPSHKNCYKRRQQKRNRSVGLLPRTPCRLLIDPWTKMQCNTLNVKTVTKHVWFYFIRGTTCTRPGYARKYHESSDSFIFETIPIFFYRLKKDFILVWSL